MKLENVLHKGPRVLVPIRLEAMLVDHALRQLENGKWARSSAKYNQLFKGFQAAFPRQNAIESSGSEQDPISDLPPSMAPECGIHLHWQLPPGLRHGSQTESSTNLSFPQVPNRWALIRLWLDEKQEIRKKCWIVQSDFIANHEREKTQFLLQDEQTNEYVWKQIGKVHLLTEDTWPEMDSNGFGLSAIGVEDFTFNAYTVNNQNVFTMVDDLKDLQTMIEQADQDIDHVALSYFAIGWYDNPEADPLYQSTSQYGGAAQERLLETLEKLQIRVGEGNLADLRQAEEAFESWCEDSQDTFFPLMLCFGGIHSIQWYGYDNVDSKKSNSRTGKPEIDRRKEETIPGIGMAYTGIDALIAFIADRFSGEKMSEEEIKYAINLMHAFDKGLLDAFTLPEGEGLLNREIHHSWFESEPGGSEWRLVKQVIPNTKEESQEVERQFLAAQERFVQLNREQMELNDLQALRQSILKELFTSLYGSKRAPKEQQTEWLNLAELYYARLQELDENIQSLSRRIQKQGDEIQGIFEPLKGNPEGGPAYALKEQLLPSYWLPSDPVLLVHGAKSNSPPAFEQTLKARYSGQWIDTLTLYETGTLIDISIDDIPQAHLLPKELGSLLEEFVLLNPSFATKLAGPDASTMKIQQTMIWNSEKYPEYDGQRLTEQAGFKGLRPEFIANQPYTPPWSPLFLDWEVYFFQEKGRQPVSSTQASHWLENWHLTTDSVDYEWNEAVSPPKVDSDRSDPYFWDEKGRSLITSDLPKILQSKLAHLRKEQLPDPLSELLTEVSDVLENFDVITQRLSGLNQFWMQYDLTNPMPAELLAPADSSMNLDALAETYFGIPDGNRVVEDGDHLNHFFPLRSGFLLPHFVRITDQFGIGLYPTGTYKENQLFVASDTDPIPKGIGMDNLQIHESRMVQLPPRLLMPARIRMEWIDATSRNPSSLLDQSGLTSPIAGWVIPNHLDKSLMIFDVEGHLECSLIFFERDEKFELRKENNPLKPQEIGSGIRNPFLHAFVERLLDLQDDDGGSLTAFFQNIKISTWVTDPQGSAAKKEMASLIGRPLALVRARIGMEIKGSAPRPFDFLSPQSYHPDKPANPFGLMDVEFPFYVGADNLPNNGLIGYFDTDDFATFHVIEDHATEQAAFVQKRTTLQTRLNSSAMSDTDRNYVHLSMLMDYRGVVHTVSGLLPVVEIALSDENIEKALANMELILRIGPLMSDPYQLRMPNPQDIRGKLSWIYKSGLRIWKDDKPPNPDAENIWENQDIGQFADTASFPIQQRNRLSEGWLRLRGALGEENKDAKDQS